MCVGARAEGVVSPWLLWLLGNVSGWTLRALWINKRHVQRLLKEGEWEMEHGDLDGAKAKLAKATAIFEAIR